MHMSHQILYAEGDGLDQAGRARCPGSLTRFRILRVIVGVLLTASFVTAAHAQGSMDFSGATTLMKALVQIGPQVTRVVSRGWRDTDEQAESRVREALESICTQNW